MSDKDAFIEVIRKVIPLAMKLKQEMIAKGERKCLTKCPECGGKVHAILAGRRNHIHMACETEGCCVRMME